MNQCQIERRPAPHHLAARRHGSAARPTDSWTGWPPPGQSLVAGAAAGAARPLPLAVQVQLGLRRAGPGCWPIRGRRSRPPRSPTSVSATPYWIGDWEQFAGARRGRRPGALRPRVGRRCAPTPPSAACGSSATSRSTSRPAAPITASTPSCSRPGCVAGAPPDAYCRRGQLWGNPLYDWPALQRRRLPLVGGAGPAHAGRCSTWRGSTTSAGSSPTGRCPARRAHRASAAAGRAGPGPGAVPGHGAGAGLRGAVAAAGGRGPRA